MIPTKIGFIGFGLMGGSIALAIKEQPNAPICIGFQRGELPSPGLLEGKKQGVLDALTKDLKEIASCDLVLLCAPVQENLRYLKALAPLISPGTLISDIGSVKEDICLLASSLGIQGQFLGGHPMAGSEHIGFAHATPKLLENAYYLFTPTKANTQEQLRCMQELAEITGAIYFSLSPQRHDEITAAISHVPHIVASALVSLVADSDTDGQMKVFAAGGFRDITRIASSSPAMWESICLSNKKAISAALQGCKEKLEQFQALLEAQDGPGLENAFSFAKEYRDSLPAKGPGTLDRIFDLFVDIPDETGAIALIASMLAKHSISIKNIGILHNREYRDGVLRIEFYEEKSLDAAHSVLTEHGYQLYRH